MSLAHAESAVQAAASIVEKAGRALAESLAEDGRLSRSRLDDNQPQAFEFARLLAETTAAKAMLAFAGRAGRDYDADLAAVYAAQVVRNVARSVQMVESDFGLSPDDLSVLDGHRSFVGSTLSAENLARVGVSVAERGSDATGSPGVSGDHADIRELFGRFADDRVAPLAEEIHRHDRLIPEDLLQELGELGVFGISIPGEYGGSFIDHLTMCIATEELSRASLGAGGSVITRPEICAKAILKGGTDDQKREWLPKIASGQRIVSVAVTEPNAGSDVASLRVSAKPVEGGYVINGEKTWCTFAGRADLFILLARTGTPESGYRGLTLFLVEKPPADRETEEYSFVYEQPDKGGRVEGHAIPTIGYRGMHSFTVTFEDYFVPAKNRIGDEGRGFILQMEGFAGGRIQTAARAVGVMEAAVRSAVEYVRERKVFGKALSTYSLPQAKLALMAATVQASRQFCYHVAKLMDEGEGGMEASLVKLMSCKDAEWVTREAMQLHGGMGYSEEYAVSRYWQDARVLSIFEGAEEVLALYVVARTWFRGALDD